MKPKQWLADNGHIDKADINKRGRMSGAHVALIKEAVAAGVHIEGYSVSKPAVQTAKPAGETVERDKATSTGIADVPDMVRDDRDWDVFDDAGKPFVIGIKGCCENCRNSLTYCHCKFPVLRVDNSRVSVVTFKPKG